MDLYEKGHTRNLRVQVVEGRVRTLFLRRQIEGGAANKSANKNDAGLATLGTLIRWLSDNTEVKTLTISLEKIL